MSPARPRAQDGHLVFEMPVLPSGILRGDCLELMPELPTACVDLVLTDPPYGHMTGNRVRDRRDQMQVAAPALPHPAKPLTVVRWRQPRAMPT